MHEKTRLAQNSHMNIVNIGIDVLNPLKRQNKNPPFTLTRILPRPPPPWTPWTVKKALQSWAYKKMKIFIRSIFKTTRPLVDKAPAPWNDNHIETFWREMVQNRQKYQQLLSHWNQPIRRVARVFLWSDWLRDVWILYSVAKSCCPLVVNKIYTQTSAVCTNTDPLWRETSHAIHCLVTVITLEADFPFTPTFIYSFLSPEVISLTVCISQHKITIPYFFWLNDHTQIQTDFLAHFQFPAHFTLEVFHTEVPSL